MTVWERVQAEFACEHPDQQLCKFVASNGAVHYWQHCQQCGEKVKAVRGVDISRHIKNSLPELDQAIRRRWQDAQRRRFEQLRIEEEERRERVALAENAEWWERYAQYLTTSAWRQKRAAVLERAGHLCEGCREQRATQVHHLTYARVYNELLFDLVAICDACHDHATTTDREARQRFWKAS